MRKNVYILTLVMLAMALHPAKAAYDRTYTKDFEVRCQYVDCRTEVMTVEAIKALAADLAPKGINSLLIEYEATFPFDKHATLCNRYAYTKEQIKDLVSYCAGLGIDVIPLQNCFGHSEYILRHERYYDLREDIKEVSQVCPLKIPQATPVFKEIFAEVAALHPSKYFHIGADETYLLGDCKNCAAVAAREGKSRLFVDYIKAMSQIVIDMGKIPVIWADIILMYPDAVRELPKELIFVDWNYGWEPDRFGKLDNLFKAGVKMWGAPALRSAPDNLYLTQWKKHFDNLSVFVPFARKAGYTGMIQTSWSTGGTYGFHYDMHYEVLSMQPIRYVYPMSGFNILLDAFAKSVTEDKPLDSHKFITDYCISQYGLDKAGAEVMWDYFCMPQEVIRITAASALDAKGTPLDKVLGDCVALKARLDGLSAKTAKKEFAHYALMLDLRINYLQYKQVEAVYESSSYDRSQAAGLCDRLTPVVKAAASLDKRFADLNRGYLKYGEILYLNTMRSERMRELYESLLSAANR